MALNSLWGNIKSEVEFLNQYPTLLQATSDNDSPIPGYLFGDINDLTFVNGGEYCTQITNFLISRVQSDSEIARYKALKIFLHIIRNGHIFLFETIKAHEVHLKESFGSIKSPQDSVGTYAQDSKIMLKELLFLIFSESFQLERLEESNSKTTHEVPIGYGAQASANKLQGFGNAPNISKTMGDRMTESLTTFVDKILSPSNEDDFYKKQASILSESLPQYKPMTIEKDNPTYMVETPVKISSSEPLHSKLKKPVHIAGRAGGGWDDSDTEIEEETVISLDDSPDLSISTDSPEKKTGLSTALDYAEERQVVDEFLVDLPLIHIKYKEIDLLCKRCLNLNCDKILEILIEKLDCDKENVKLRSLIFMEYLLQQDVIQVRSLLKIAVPHLTALSQMPKSSIQTKAKKICLIIDCINRCTNSSQAPQVICTTTSTCEA